MTVVPFAPRRLREHVESGRVAAALRETIDAEGVKLGSVLPAEERAVNMFDWHDGMRICLARVLPIGAKKEVLHVSAGAVPDSRLWLDGESGACPLERFCRLVESRVAKLLGARLNFAGLDRDRCPHWYSEELEGFDG